MRRVLPLDSVKGGASVDRIDNIISIATKLITDIITRIVEAPESEWPTPRPDLKGRQHSNKSTCPWLVPTFCNQATKPTVETKTRPTKAKISVEVDISKTMTSSNEVESTTTFVTMKEDAVKDIIRIDTTEVPSIPMTVTLDEVLLVLGSKRPIELDAAQYTEHSPKISKTNEDCVDSTFMVPAAKETSAPSQAEDRTAKSDTIERKCTTQMQATVTEEKMMMPTKRAPVKKKKATKDTTLFWSHAQGSLEYALFPDGYNGQQNAPHNRVSAIGCNYPNCSSLPESKLCKLKCGHTACSQCIALKPAFTNDLMQAVGGSKKPRRSAPRRSAAVDCAKKLKIEYIDDEAIPAVNEFQGCFLCNSKLMQRWAKLASVDIKSQGRKLTIADIKKNGGNYVDYEHEHKESIPKLGNDSSEADTSTEDDEEVDKSSAEVDSELASLLQNVPRKPQRKGEEMILESKSRLRQLIK